MFDNFSKMVSKKMASNEVIPLADEELYSYGICQGLIILLNIASALTIGLIMGMIWESIILLLSYIPIRTYAGGYHSKSPVRCYIYSLVLITLQLQCMKYVSWSQHEMIVLSVLAGLLVCKMAPVETRNKSLNEQEKKNLYIKSKKNFKS